MRFCGVRGGCAALIHPTKTIRSYTYYMALGIVSIQPQLVNFAR